MFSSPVLILAIFLRKGRPSSTFISLGGVDWDFLRKTFPWYAHVLSMFPCFLRSLAFLKRAAFFLRTFFVHLYSCAFQVLSPHHDISLYCVVNQAHDNWFNPFVFSTRQFFTGNNVARQKLYAHGLIYEISNLFSEACEFATTLSACAICLHRVVPARRSRVAAGLEVQPVVFLWVHFQYVQGFR